MQLIHQRELEARLDENNKWLDVYAQFGDDISDDEFIDRIEQLSKQKGQEDNE